MLIFLMFNTIFMTSFQELTFEDFKRRDTFLIYAYYDKPGQECQACLNFNEKMATITSLPIKAVNFYSKTYLGAHLLEFIFPSFIIREDGKSYVLNISSFPELLRLLDSGDWRNSQPVKWYLDVESPLTKVIAVFSFIFFYTMDRWAFVIDNTPPFVITSVICFVIAYLIVSIIGIFKEDIPKVKKD
ncbi:hypothetical protein NGRA_0728 [Nosema granulosis]|uniref:Thioredoxin domain-containing protein n=1 Tax=Nosema granulosis TaxID=83296 RepID=A0A9P6KZW1_9MICR|nr:hypothetical protein NGRA_0728 [Nosema granulosis]